MQKQAKNGRLRRTMIDLHTHLLPQLDDGSRSVDESLAMLKQYDASVTQIVLTPHFYPLQDRLSSFLEKREAAYRSLIERLPQNAPQFHLGAEVAYFDRMRHSDVVTQFLIGKSRLLLCEMPMQRWEEKMFSDLLEAAHRFRFTVVLAHIDRYRLNGAAWTLIDSFVAQGGLTQINTCALQGKLKKKAKQWIKEGKVHFLGSDCHGAHHRTPDLCQTLQMLKDEGEDEVLSCLQRNADAYFPQ
jgi:protein-tyrosine phosphatase